MGILMKRTKKILIITFFSMATFSSFSKCRSYSKEDYYNNTPIFIEGEVFNANFKILGNKIISIDDKKNLTKKRNTYAKFKVKVLRVLKGKLDHKVLIAANPKLVFGFQSKPPLVYGVKNGNKRVFGINSVDKNGKAEVHTSYCSPILELSDIDLLRK